MRGAIARGSGVLSVRNFRLLFLGRTISFFGTNLVPIALAFAVLDLTGSASDVGVVFAARTLAQVSMLLVGGVFADRLSRQRVMIASDASNLLVQLTMGTLLVAGNAQLWHLVVLQVLGGAATAFHSPASSGLVPQTVPADRLPQANAYMNVARYTSFIAGAAVGGALVATIGSGWAILLDGGTYAASAVLLARMRLPAAARAAVAPNFLRELADGWRAFTEHTWVWLLNLWVALYFLVTYAPVFVLGPYIAKQSLGGAPAWATIVTGEAVGSLVGALIALRITPNRTWAWVGSLFAVSALQSLLLAAKAPVAAIAVAAALAGLSFSYGSIVWETAIQRRIPGEKLSRVSAYSWFGAMAFLPAGYAIAGPIGGAIGMSTYLVAGAAWIVASTAGLLCVRDVREFRMDGGPEAAPESAPLPA